MVGMSPSRYPTASTIRTVLRILRYLTDYRWHLVVASLCSVAVAGLAGTYAWLVRPFLDEVLIQKNHTLLVLLSLAFLGVAVVKSLLSFLQSYLLIRISIWIVADIRQQLFFHLIRLPVRFHDAHSSGRLVSRINNDAGAMGSAVPAVMRNVLQEAFTFLTMIGVLFYQNSTLAIWLVAILPVSAYAAIRIGKRLRRLSILSLELAGDISSFLTETFSGIRILKTFGREDADTERFRASNADIVRTALKSGHLAVMTSPLLGLIGGLSVMGIMWYGGSLVISGEMTTGAFFSFLTAMFLAYSPVRRMASSNNVIQQAVAAADRVFDILGMEHELARDQRKATLPLIARSLEFRNVSFRYESCPEPALRDINLSMEAGRVVALVGRSGSGKSTVVSLVSRLYEPTAGTILMDGQDIRQFSLASLRRQIAVVAQDAMLFDDTVRNNIAYGRVGAGEDQIRAAAEAGYAWEFIHALPHGLDTIIGERGVKLSGGQRQRIAIARAILRDAPFLILDEATSSLDSESELMVQRALTNLMRNRTTLVIAHRLSTVLRADCIVVLNGGRVVGCGTHDDLLSGCEMYRRLYYAQFQERLVTPLTE